MIKIENLEFTYGDNFNLKINNLLIKSGERVSIIGPNGSGKSTLIKIISKLISNYQGKISIKGKYLNKYTNKELSRYLAVVPQEFNTIFNYDVESIISTARLPYSKRFSFFENYEDRNIIEKSLQYADLENMKNKIFSNLSGGEKQRVMIARAFAQEADILLLDEFTSHLDPGHTDLLMKLVEEFSDSMNKTVISIFHDINLASIFSKRIIVMKNGRVFKDGSPKEVITKGVIKEAYDFEGHIIDHPVKHVPQILF
ncbi:ABC transporter ATP-binding protein [Geotoga petraea]|uniref:ABC transporter ATP-binding protein n=1 Tax=Geotoga petraea TaxID=28234 RepID=A0A1G6IEL2_9BACT|nr:ABC transporter ATP-binding protein [Geotoga petraea]TGG89173.1 ABC transporter ATP-binding protein [Geotoga petraea]SDC04465.1 iron complex transport system ATP-binding protein [Geotoga petraea]